MLTVSLPKGLIQDAVDIDPSFVEAFSEATDLGPEPDIQATLLDQLGAHPTEVCAMLVLMIQARCDHRLATMPTLKEPTTSLSR